MPVSRESETRMSAVKFNQVFVGLISLSILSAFVINPKYTNRIRNFQGLFAPVALPVRHMAAAVNDRFSKPAEPDHRDLTVVRAENAELRTTLMGLMGQLEQLKQTDEERRQLGHLRPLCSTMKVAGDDTGTSESLILPATTGDTIMQGMAVVYTQGLVGRIDRVGPGGSQVQLITDKTFRVTARFQCWEKAPDGSLIAKYRDTATLAVVQGAGKGAMFVDTITQKDAEKLQIGDEVVLYDAAWPTTLRGQRLGQITSITSRRDAPQFFQVHIKPMRNLKELQEVQVLTKVAPTAR
jgi:cell shape-determining protein MreC